MLKINLGRSDEGFKNAARDKEIRRKDKEKALHARATQREQHNLTEFASDANHNVTFMSTTITIQARVSTRVDAY